VSFDHSGHCWPVTRRDVELASERCERPLKVARAGWMAVQEVRGVRGRSRACRVRRAAAVDQERHQSIVEFNLRWRELPLQDVSCVGPSGWLWAVAGIVAQGSRCRYRAVDVGGIDGPGDDTGGRKAGRFRTTARLPAAAGRVRPNNLQISTSPQADKEIRGAHPLMTAATHWQHPGEASEPRDRLGQAARDPYTMWSITIRHPGVARRR
jgi:hypothetical protein